MQYQHLDEEVAHLAPANMRVFTDDEITTFLAGFQKEIVRNADPWTDLPYAVTHTPPSVAWPPLPWVLRRVFIPFVFRWRYSG